MRKKIAVLISALMMLALCGCSESEGSISSPADASGKTIGAVKGSASEVLAGELGTVRSYDTPEEVAAALRVGSVDCALSPDMQSDAITGAQRGLRVLRETLIPKEWRIAVAKENIGLTRDINAAIEELTDKGVISSVERFYRTGKGETYAHGATDEDAAYLTLAVPKSFYPYSYIDENGDWAGIDIDIAYAICDYLGVGLEIKDVRHSDLVNSVWKGEAEFAMGALYENGETLKKLDLTDPYISAGQVLIVRK